MLCVALGLDEDAVLQERAWRLCGKQPAAVLCIVLLGWSLVYRISSSSTGPQHIHLQETAVWAAAAWQRVGSRVGCCQYICCTQPGLHCNASCLLQQHCWAFVIRHNSSCFHADTESLFVIFTAIGVRRKVLEVLRSTQPMACFVCFGV